MPSFKYNGLSAYEKAFFPCPEKMFLVGAFISPAYRIIRAFVGKQCAFLLFPPYNRREKEAPWHQKERSAYARWKNVKKRKFIP